MVQLAVDLALVLGSALALAPVLVLGSASDSEPDRVELPARHSCTPYFWCYCSLPFSGNTRTRLGGSGTGSRSHQTR